MQLNYLKKVLLLIKSATLMIKKEKNISEIDILKTLLFLSVYLCLTLFLNANEFKYKIIGKLNEDNVINFPNGGKFIAFQHEGGFETDIGRYGEYLCSGSILYDKDGKLENMFFACENFDQNGESFINMGKRFKGSDMDRAVGSMTIVEAEGFWKDYIGYKCTYAVEYVSDVIFAPALCKNLVN